MTQQQTAVEAHTKRGYWLNHPKEIDRTQTQRNRDGEVVPFDTMKLCTKCNTEKDLWDGFHYRASSTDLHQSWCKKCVREYKGKGAQDNQGAKLLAVPASTRIHVGHSVHAPEMPRRALTIVPVVTPVAVESSEEETEVFAQTTAPVEEAVTQETAAIISVTAIEEHPVERRGFQFAPSSFVDFQDWLTDPSKAKGMFMTRGAEAIVTTREDGMCWIATANQSGPGQWMGPELAAYILKLLTGENTDEAFVGLLYR